MPPFRFLVLSAAFAAAPVAGSSASESETAPSVLVGGRLEVEASTTDPSPAAARRFPFEDGADFRRARLLLIGSHGGRFEFKIEHDISTGDLAPTDVYLGLAPEPAAPGFRIGHFKEPFGLAVLTSSNFLAFIERPAAVTSMAPFRNAGVMVHGGGPADRIGWAIGAFLDTDGYDVPHGSGWNLSGRLAGVVLDGTDSAGALLHLGAGASYRQPTAGSIRLRGRTGVKRAPAVVDTREFPAEAMGLLGLEFAFARGPLWLQAELLLATLNLPQDRRTVRLNGNYVAAGWFFTRERRPYSREFRTFARVQPRAPLPKGAGAWELAARWDHVDLHQRSVDGGSKQSMTLGLNWHLRRELRVLLNHVSTEPAGAGSVEHVGLLLHVDF